MAPRSWPSPARPPHSLAAALPTPILCARLMLTSRSWSCGAARLLERPPVGVDSPAATDVKSLVLCLACVPSTSRGRPLVCPPLCGWARAAGLADARSHCTATLQEFFTWRTRRALCSPTPAVEPGVRVTLGNWTPLLPRPCSCRRCGALAHPAAVHAHIARHAGVGPEALSPGRPGSLDG